MAFNEIKDNLDEIKSESEAFINSNLDYYKLWGFKVTAKAVSTFMTLVLVGICILMSLLFISLFAAFALSEYFKSTAIGFLIVSAFYILIAILAYLLRKSIVEKPMLRKLSEIIFND